MAALRAMGRSASINLLARRTALWIPSILLAALLLPGAALLLLRATSEPGQLARPEVPLRLISDIAHQVETPGGPRLFRELVLLRSGSDSNARHSDTLHCTLSLPMDHDDGPLPFLLLMGGAGAGQESLRYLDNHGANAMLAYEYPYREEKLSRRQWYTGHTLAQVPAIRRSVLAVPSQVRDLVRWTRSQPWADSTRTALLGFSFGALFAPSIQKQLQEAELMPAATVLAYGGADLGSLLRHNLGKVPAWSRPVLAWVVESLIHPVEPAYFLPLMQGPILAINGMRDEQIPAANVALLHTLLPTNSEIMMLDEGHLHPRRPELTRNVVEIARAWLIRIGVASP